MVRWWIFLVFHFSIALAQKNCGTRVDIPAPVFGDGDNLSSDMCGNWDPQIKEFAPWDVKIKTPNAQFCWGLLITPSSFLGYFCYYQAGGIDPESENIDNWEAHLGMCTNLNSDVDTCVENGEGQIVKIQSVTKLNIPGYPVQLHISKIERVMLKKNYIAPICMFNKGNRQDFNRTQQYTAFEWNKPLTAEFLEDFGPCLKKSHDFKACDKIHENFLCVRLSEGKDYPLYLTHHENKRHYLRALLVEVMSSKSRFYYEVVPLLDQIALLSGDMPLMPKVLQAKQKTNFVGGESFPGCGTLSSKRRKRDFSSEKAVGYIYHGAKAKRNKQPWNAALIFLDDIICGATLISTTALVTAAHCVVHDDGTPMHRFNIEVIVGLHYLDEKDNLSLSREYTKTPSHIIPHENFNPEVYDNDVAVLLVADPGFEVTATVRPICLWNQDYDLKLIENAYGKVVGYGFMENSTRPDTLQKVNLRVQSYKKCYLKRATACGGDSGGGFTMKIEGKWFLRGVVSSGRAKRIVVNGQNVPICNGSMPSLYADVTNYMDWIVEKANLQTILSN